MASALPSFPAFDVGGNPSSLGTRWNTWLRRFDNLTLAMDVNDDNKRKRALLLHYAGPDVHEIFQTLSDTGLPEDYDTAASRLNGYFSPKKNTDFETLMFRQAKQDSGETVDVFHTRLRKLASTCEFSDIEKEIKMQIIQMCSSASLRRRALREPNITLTNLLTLARSLEQSESQALEIESDMSGLSMRHESEETHLMTSKQRSPDVPVSSNTSPRQSCGNCGYTLPHRFNGCPASNKRCAKCNKPGHFAKVCRSGFSNRNYASGEQRKSTRVNTTFSQEFRPSSRLRDAHVEENIFEESTFVLDELKCSIRQHFVKVSIGSNSFQWLVDTGSTINLINMLHFQTMCPKPVLEPCSVKVFTYGSTTPLPICGMFQTVLTFKGKSVPVSVVVTADTNAKSTPLLGLPSSTALGIVAFNGLCAEDEDSPFFEQHITSKYNDLFQGVGKLSNFQVHLHIDKNVKPVAQAPRRVPVHLRGKLADELEAMINNDVIEKVHGPTPWVSPIVLVPKPNDPSKIRVCTDMRVPNQAISRERHVMPTIDDIISRLNGAKYFTKLDLNSGYHQLELDPESRNITVFTTHKGLYQYKRLNFGINAASEIFQNAIEQVLHDIPNACNSSDDILVFGNTSEEHDKTLEQVLQRLRNRHLTLNRRKCQIKKRSLVFYGMVFGDGGISPDPQKVVAIKNAVAPTTVSEIRSFLGLINYCTRFLPNLASVAEPLRNLTKKDVSWEWGPTQENSWKLIKDLLVNSTYLSYFDPAKKTELFVDASPVGLGAMLAQTDTLGNTKVVSFGSKSLSPVEQRFSQTEREALAIVWGCEHFHYYLYGCQFTVVSDHKPLEVLFNKATSPSPARIERWRLRLQSYQFSVQYRDGKKNPADYISRHPVLDKSPLNASKSAEDFVHFVVKEACPIALRIDDIRDHTMSDPTLQMAIKFLQYKKWDFGSIRDIKNVDFNTLRSLHNIRDELSVTKGILLKARRIVVPKSLQSRVLLLAHEGHQGMVKTKQLLRQKVWFPNMDILVERLIESCVPCISTGAPDHVEPLKMSPMPKSPWVDLSLDFCGPLPSGEYLLVLMDDYSRYPYVQKIRSTSAEHVLPVLRTVFTLFGVPEKIRTDNGPPFFGTAFKNFAVEFGFEHRRITPYWPQANGVIERFMRTLKKTLQCSSIQSNEDMFVDLKIFLMNYRSTPHSSTGVSPAFLMFGREIKTKIPNAIVERRRFPSARQADNQAKQKMKKYADNARKSVQIPPWEKGEKVLAKNPKRGKLQPAFSPTPLKVVSQKGSMVSASHPDGHIITRNRSCFKKTYQAFPEKPRILDAEIDDFPFPLVEVPRRQEPVQDEIQEPCLQENPRNNQPRYNMRSESARRPPRYYAWE